MNPKIIRFPQWCVKAVTCELPYQIGMLDVLPTYPHLCTFPARNNNQIPLPVSCICQNVPPNHQSISIKFPYNLLTQGFLLISNKTSLKNNRKSTMNPSSQAVYKGFSIRSMKINEKDGGKYKYQLTQTKKQKQKHLDKLPSCNLYGIILNLCWLSQLGNNLA